jgi:ABC-type multidrug transport system fused ATPase/permease subunit
MQQLPDPVFGPARAGVDPHRPVRQAPDLPLSFFRNNRSGDLLARLMGDTEILRQVIAQGSSDLIKQPATLIAALAVLASIWPSRTGASSSP